MTRGDVGLHVRCSGVWLFESWGKFLAEHTTGVSPLDRFLHFCHTVVTNGGSYPMKQAWHETASVLQIPSLDATAAIAAHSDG